MRKIELFLTCVITIFIVNQGYAQINYTVKAETGYAQYLAKIVQVEPGANWKGYYLYKENGIDFTITNGIDFKNKLFAGVGVGYLNFEGINGFLACSDFEYVPFKSRLRPLINLKIGYSHIWNQYKNGTGTGYSELCAGLNYRLTEKIDLYVKSGFTITQQSLLTPIKIGVRL